MDTKIQSVITGDYQKYRWLKYSIIDSTNSACLELARSGDLGFLWISSELQTAGRGRYGRQWVSKPGNLYASLLLKNPADRLSLIGQLPFLAVLGLGLALEELTNHNNLAEFKWPNDLLINGAKVAGILLESEQTKDNQLYVVLGFGVNCNNHPEQSLYPATNLERQGFQIESEDLFCCLVEQIDKLLHNWNRGLNFSMIRDQWFAKALGVGQTITIKISNAELEGTFENIDETGLLELRLKNGEIKKISAGDVFLF